MTSTSAEFTKMGAVMREIFLGRGGLLADIGRGITPDVLGSGKQLQAVLL
jgi:hypothetical protein